MCSTFHGKVVYITHASFSKFSYCDRLEHVHSHLNLNNSIIAFAQRGDSRILNSTVITRTARVQCYLVQNKRKKGKSEFL